MKVDLADFSNTNMYVDREHAESSHSQLSDTSFMSCIFTVNVFF